MKSSLKDYLGFGTAFLAGVSANAYVDHTDFDPDIWWQWDSNNFSFPVDVDHDGLYDFRFFTFESSTEYYSCSGFAAAFFIEPYRSNLLGNGLLPVPTPSYVGCVCVGMDESFYNLTMGVKPVYFGETISSDDQWGNAQLLFASNSCDWPDPIYGMLLPNDFFDYFIPVQLRDHGNHYGWIRLTHEATYAVKKIMDMAYETNENVPIVAGVLKDEVITENGPNIIFENILDGFVLHPVNLSEPADFIVTDINGKIIQSDKIFNSDVFISDKLISTGVYLITVSSQEGKWVKKILN